MKIKALDSFSASEVGMVHAGTEFDASEVSEQRLEEWRAKGLIPKAADTAGPTSSLDLTPEGIGRMTKADVTELLAAHGVDAGNAPVAKLREILTGIVFVQEPEA